MLTYGSEAWTICKGDERRITAAEMKFIRTTTDYTHFNFESNSDIMKELDTQLIMEFIQRERTGKTMFFECPAQESRSKFYCQAKR
jgi:hypothetical protein